MVGSLTPGEHDSYPSADMEVVVVVVLSDLPSLFPFSRAFGKEGCQHGSQCNYLIYSFALREDL